MLCLKAVVEYYVRYVNSLILFYPLGHLRGQVVHYGVHNAWSNSETMEVRGFVK